MSSKNVNSTPDWFNLNNFDSNSFLSVSIYLKIKNNYNYASDFFHPIDKFSQIEKTVMRITSSFILKITIKMSNITTVDLQWSFMSER